VRDGAAAPGGHEALHSRLHERRGALAVVGTRAARRARAGARGYLRYGAGGLAVAPPPLPRGAAGCAPGRAAPDGRAPVPPIPIVAVLTPTDRPILRKSSVPDMWRTRYRLELPFVVDSRDALAGKCHRLRLMMSDIAFDIPGLCVRLTPGPGSVQGRCVSKPPAPPLRRFRPALRWNEPDECQPPPHQSFSRNERCELAPKTAIIGPAPSAVCSACSATLFGGHRVIVLLGCEHTGRWVRFECRCRIVG
jgi:hypothetical protein